MATQRNGTQPEPERLHAVRRTLAVLETLATKPEGVTPKAVSLALGLHLSTCYRLLNTLVAAGYVARDGDGLFRLGSRVAYLHHGYLATLRPPREALSFVHALQLATSESAILNRLEGDDVVVTAFAAGTRPGSIPPGYVGLAVPAHAVASGRALLASFPAPQLEAFLARRATDAQSPFPLSNPDALRTELDRVRRAGYALDEGDGRHNVCCIAAPVVAGSDGVTTSIAIVAPCTRFHGEKPTLAAAILAVSRAIESLRAAAPARKTGSDGDLQDADTATQAAIEAVVADIADAMSRV